MPASDLLAMLDAAMNPGFDLGQSPPNPVGGSVDDMCPDAPPSGNRAKSPVFTAGPLWTRLSTDWGQIHSLGGLCHDRSPIRTQADGTPGVLMDMGRQAHAGGSFRRRSRWKSENFLTGVKVATPSSLILK
jgi:hypothetical protein